MDQETSRRSTSKTDTEPFATERTIGFDQEIQAALDTIYAGADASSAKEFLDKYIWTKLWNHVRFLCTCKPTLEELLMHREALKSCMDMAHDLNLRMKSAKYAADKLKALYKLKN